jgi:outer membrane biosynthesis protein TonB
VPADATHPVPRLRARRALSRRATASRSVYWVGALAAAAIVALATALVVQLSGHGIKQNTTGPSLAGEGPGVPGTSGGNRTDPLTSPSGKGEASGINPGASQPDRGTPSARPQESPVLPPEEVTGPAAPDAPAVPQPDNPAPKSGPVVEEPRPETTPAPEGTPPARVEDTPDARKTHAEPKPGPAPASPAVLARLTILGGKAETLGPDGKWRALSNDDELRQGMQVRTNANGNASVVFADGTVTLAKGSCLTVADVDKVSLDSGTVALDRPNARDGESLAVVCDSYTVYVMHGTAMLRRKTRGMEMQHFVGLSTITHEDFGSVVLEQAASVDLEFGKDYPAAKALGAVQAPDWVAEARTTGLLAAIEPKITERFADAIRERRELDKNLPRALRRLMVYPLDQASALEFLTRALDNHRFDAATIVRMVYEVETAIAETKDADPNTVAYNAARSAMLGTVKDFTTWRETFLRLTRGETQRPPQASTPRKPEVIEAGKFRKPVPPPPAPTPKPKPEETEPEKAPEQPSK